MSVDDRELARLCEAMNVHPFDSDDLEANRLGRVTEKQRGLLGITTWFGIGCGVLATAVGLGGGYALGSTGGFSVALHVLGVAGIGLALFFLIQRLRLGTSIRVEAVTGHAWIEEEGMGRNRYTVLRIGDGGPDSRSFRLPYRVEGLDGISGQVLTVYFTEATKAILSLERG